MSETNLVLGLLSGVALALVGALVWGVTRTAADGGWHGNQAAGIRTAATKASPQAWAAGHRAALPWARRLGIFAVVLGFVLVASGFLGGPEPGTVHPATIAAWVVGYGGVLLGVVPLTRSANRGARKVHAAVRPPP